MRCSVSVCGGVLAVNCPASDTQGDGCVPSQMPQKCGGSLGNSGHKRIIRRCRVSLDDRFVRNEAINRDRLGHSRGYCGRLVSSVITRLAEADRHSRIASRIANRRIARCSKARATYRTAIAIRWAAYAVILGLVGVLAWQVEETHRRIARRREAERIEIQRPESDRQSRIVWADMCGIVGESRGY